MDDQAEAETVLQLRQQLEEKSRRLEELEEAIFQAAGQRSTSTTPLTALEQFELDMKERELIDNERDEELRLLQEALEEALEEKAELESQLLQDGSRQTQMLDDFEWKLGEIERDYKKKIAETEKTVEERVKNDMTAQHQQLIDDKNTIDEKLSEIAHLKSYEAEVTQLRGLIHEQQRALRVASRQVDQLRVSERMLSDDVSKMRTQGYTRKQQQEMEHKWEEKMQAECKRLRHELQLRAEEEQLRVIAQVTRDKEDQVTNAKRQSDAMQLKLNSQMAELRMTIEKKDAELRKQMESSRTLADRQMCDFRHKMSKLQDSHQEIVDSLEHKHAQEIEQCQRIAVDKETQEREFEEKLRSTETQHQTQLNALQDLIEEEKQEALTDLGDHYRSQLQDLQEHIIALQHKLVEAERKKNEEIARLKAKLISDHEGEVQTLQKKLEELQTLRKQLEGQSQNSASSSSAGEETDEEEEQQQPEDEEEEEEDEDEEEEEEEEEEEDEEEEEEEETDEDEESEDTPPIGRSAGDGCSPSNSRDQLRSCKEEIASPVLMFDVETQAELLNYEFYCNDPDHVDAHTIILEMHQILADRDAELQRLTEEKRFYQLELIHWERNLSHQRAGLPLMLIPDNFANASAQLWKGFSAPPMTKPRLIDHPIIPPVLSRSGSYEIFSDSASASQADVQAARSTHSHSIFEDEDDYRSEMSGRSNSGFVTPF